METAVKTILSVSSSAFEHEGLIPKKYSCEGAGKNPPLHIAGIPEETRSLAIIVEDPDATHGVFDHWLVWNIRPKDTIPEGIVPGLEGKNSGGEIGYIGPCPPSGTHRYFFKVFAVDCLLEVEMGADKRKLNYVLENHILAYGELIGLYRNTKS